MKEKFIEMYGDIDQHLTDEKWMGWYGIWVSAYAEARKEIGAILSVACKYGPTQDDGWKIYFIADPATILEQIESLKKGEMPSLK